MKKSIFVALLFFVFQPVRSQDKERPYVLLISLDGFSSSYVDKYGLPNLKEFIRTGAAAGLIPSFPSKTFPNHYTIVTGLYPGNHGLVDNHFYDPIMKVQYSMRNREAVRNPAFYGGVPLWLLARQQNVKSAAYFWVGSEQSKEELRPHYYFDYDQSVPDGKRIDQIIEWLNLPEAQRPHFLTLYFSSPDWESHRTGPHSEETKAKVIQMDSIVGVIMKRVAATRLPVNVILVSDHGMSELVSAERTFIFLDEIIKTIPGKVTVVNGGTQAHIYTTSSLLRDSIFGALRKRAEFSVLKQEKFPRRWHFTNPRVGDLLITAPPGKYIVTGEREKVLSGLPGKTFGAHGYDPKKVPEMIGIFYANGPNIKPGMKMKPIENIHIYPLICKILQLDSPRVDGKFSVAKKIYRK